LPRGTFALGRGNWQEKRLGNEKRVSKEKEKEKQRCGGGDFMEYMEKQRGAGGTEWVGKRGCAGKRVLNAVENRRSLEGSNGAGAGCKAEGARGPLGVYNLKKMSRGNK